MDHRNRVARVWLGGTIVALLTWVTGAETVWAFHPDDEPRRRYTLKNRKDEVIGGSYYRHRVTVNDTMIMLARDNHLGFNEIMLANPDQDPWSPRVGSKIRLDFRKVLPGLNNPARIVVNLPEMRVYHLRGERIETYPIGVGQEGMMTPRVRTVVTGKMADPIWRPPASIRKEDPTLPEAIYPGPRNPLGTHAIYLSLPAYLMHGTNRPLGVGRRVSHGCIRLYPEDIVSFFPNVKAGDTVAIVNEPAKAGWRDGELYLEVYPILTELKNEGTEREWMSRAIKQALARRPDLQVVVDWRLAERMADNPDGQSRRVGVATNASAEGRDAYLIVPEIPEEQTIPPQGLRLPNLEQLDREDGNPAAIRVDQAVPTISYRPPVAQSGARQTPSPVKPGPASAPAPQSGSAAPAPKAAPVLSAPASGASSSAGPESGSGGGGGEPMPPLAPESTMDNEPLPEPMSLPEPSSMPDPEPPPGSFLSEPSAMPEGPSDWPADLPAEPPPEWPAGVEPRLPGDGTI
ncbi:MAG: L,D-transpeptidase family protein [Magnetococcales bacterium]|nr:L,D-transpeptidase family protein [Magnetococcales bacterium]